MTGDEVKRETMCGAHYTDIQVAGKVRMLMRSDLDHEAVCVMGRDRIMFLSQKLDKIQELVNKANEFGRGAAAHQEDPKEIADSFFDLSELEAILHD